VYEWLTPEFDVKFHRVANRLGMLVLLVGFILVARRMRLADRASLGYGLPRKRFLREAAIGLGLGVATMLPIALLMFALDLRELRPQLAIDAGWLLRLAVSGLASGIAVALIEETFMRGAMHTGIARESGVRAAIFLTSLLYAAVHFVGRYRIPLEELGPDSGLRHVLGTLADFATPLDILDAFLALFAVGVLLGMVRHLTGNIAACLGLHAGWVWIIAFLRESSQPQAQHPWRMLLSEFDGVVGWLVLAWTVVIGSVLWWYYARVSPSLRPHDESAAR
jgi:membrane protease YdiL (CAAX protease family)